MEEPEENDGVDKSTQTDSENPSSKIEILHKFTGFLDLSFQISHENFNMTHSFDKCHIGSSW
jgi:hypothetical protein